MQRRILQLHISGSRSAISSAAQLRLRCNFKIGDGKPINLREVSDAWMAQWTDGLWHVISLLNPFRPPFWVMLIRGKTEREIALAKIDAALVLKAFTLWQSPYVCRARAYVCTYNTFNAWLLAIRKSIQEDYASTCCAAHYMISWEPSLQFKFIRKIEKAARIRKCVQRVKFLHRVK